MKPLTWNNLSALRLHLLNWFHKVVDESLSQVLLNLSQLNWFFLATDTKTDSSESRLASINAKGFLSFDHTLNHVFGVNWVIFLPWFRNIYMQINCFYSHSSKIQHCAKYWKSVSETNDAHVVSTSRNTSSFLN